jgi:hypothetical protein
MKGKKREIEREIGGGGEVEIVAIWVRSRWVVEGEV